MSKICKELLQINDKDKQSKRKIGWRLTNKHKKKRGQGHVNGLSHCSPHGSPTVEYWFKSWVFYFPSSFLLTYLARQHRMAQKPGSLVFTWNSRWNSQILALDWAQVLWLFGSEPVDQSHQNPIFCHVGPQINIFKTRKRKHDQLVSIWKVLISGS